MFYVINKNTESIIESFDTPEARQDWLNEYVNAFTGCMSDGTPVYISSSWTIENARKEWEIAEKTGKPQTYWVYPNRKFEPEKRFVKSYTPALAKLVAKRNNWREGWDIVPFV